MSENSTFDLTMLAPQREVTVVEEEHHQATLVHYAPAPMGPPRRVVAELAVAPIARGTYAGRTGIEVRLDGARVGELTFRMSQRYLPIVDPMIRAGHRPGAHALVKHGRHGLVEVDLRLPEEGAAPVPIPAPRRPSGRRGAPPAPGPRPARTRRRWMWGVGAVIGTAVIVGAIGNAGEPSSSPSAGPAASTKIVAAPTPTAAQRPTVAPATPAIASPVTPAKPSPAAEAPVAKPAPRSAPPAAPKPAPNAAPEPATDGCDPNYSGCVPVASDVDCAGGNGNGPAYVTGPVRVTGKDVYGLDSDKDGIACE